MSADGARGKTAKIRRVVTAKTMINLAVNVHRVSRTTEPGFGARPAAASTLAAEEATRGLCLSTTYLPTHLTRDMYMSIFIIGNYFYYYYHYHYCETAGSSGSPPGASVFHYRYARRRRCRRRRTVAGPVNCCGGQRYYYCFYYVDTALRTTRVDDYCYFQARSDLRGRVENAMATRGHSVTAIERSTFDPLGGADRVVPSDRLSSSERNRFERTTSVCALSFGPEYDR